MVTTAPDADKAIAANVDHWFGNRGIPVRYRSGLAAPLEAIGSDPTDDLRALRWLQAQVIGTLKRLGERYPRSDLVAFLFDGATMDDMRAVRREMEDMEALYADRARRRAGQLERECVDGDKADCAV